MNGSAGDRWLPWLALLLAVVAFLSFDVNGLRAISPHSFEQAASVSEQLIVDGIAHTRATGDRRHPMGYIARDGGQGEFRPYLSQYGLQAVVWRSCVEAGVPLSALHHLNAALLALALAALAIGVGREFGWRSGLAAAMPFAVSPWFVLYARDLYWVAWIWLLPLLLAVWAGRSMFRPGSRPWLFALAFGGTLFVKMACGYEYVSAIALAGAAPVAYFGLRDGAGVRRVFLRLVALGGVTLVAGALAMGLHMTRFGTFDEATQRIGTLVSKRLYGADPQRVAEEACKTEVWAPVNCVPTYVQSLQASPVTVVARYLVARDVLPWFGLVSAGQETSAELKEAAATLARQRSADALHGLVRAVTVADVAKLGNSAATSLLLAGLAVVGVWRIGRAAPPRRGALAALLGLALLAPLSWYVLAKGHSYIHVVLNMSLWYVSWIPMALAVAFDRAAPSSRAST